jgi:membrane protein YdbS with pleckstrin-like domain
LIFSLFIIVASGLVALFGSLVEVSKVIYSMRVWRWKVAREKVKVQSFQEFRV